MLLFLNRFLMICDFCRPLRDVWVYNPSTSIDDINDTLNACTDRLFKVIDVFLAEHVDSLQLPNIHSSFSYSLILTYGGEVDLTNGLLQDFWSVRRGGDIDYVTTDQTIQVTLPLAFNSIRFRYDYDAEIFGVGLSGGVTGSVTDLEMKLTLSFDYTTLMVTLNDFRITPSGDIDLEFSGHVFIDWLINFLVDVLAVLLKQVILSRIEEEGRDMLQLSVDEVNKVVGEYANLTFGSFLQRMGLQIATNKTNS
ncbi:hypothetical protein MTP99_010026 [Tenebrio molitor]|nr:hypothetical protein MTP99_010026 [Tenebrio molitor]